MSFKELLPTRIPEYLQDDNELKEYLEVIGELFDEFDKEIVDFDHYHDPKLVPEKRIRDLAAKFAMDFPRNINTELQRTIIRDLEAIYQKSGTIDVIHWIFRLIGWDVKLENVWVLNPEYYDPKIKDQYELDDYGGTKIVPPLTNFYARDYRAFLIGEDYTDDGGTYFKGKHFFELTGEFERFEIIGEYYDVAKKTRTPNKVMKTPYLFVRVSEETYNIFISPYTDEDGNTFDYTEVEFFKVVENIFNFFLFDALRPSNVRVVIIVSSQFIDDTGVISDPHNEVWTADPVNISDGAGVRDREKSLVDYTAKVSSETLVGLPPNPYDKDMVISAIGFRNLTGFNSSGEKFYYKDHAGRNYSIVKEENYPVARSGATKWAFITPHEQSAKFRRIFTSEDSGIDPTGAIGNAAVYEDDLDSLSLSFDVVSGEYGIIDTSGATPIIIRNPTSVTSYIFNPPSLPANVYFIGNTDVNGDFEKNPIISMDMRDGGTTEVDTAAKDFYYVYDLEVKYKENNAQTTWSQLVLNPEIDDMLEITHVNSLAFVFNQKVPYDFEIDITYHAQEEWENRY